MATPRMSEKELAALSGLQSKAEKYLRALRRTAWVQIFLALLTQVRHRLLVPSYPDLMLLLDIVLAEDLYHANFHDCCTQVIA